jgi:TolB protein
VNGRTLPVKFRIEQGLRLGYTFAFQSDRAGGGLGELWVMNTDGTGASEVTSFEAASPSWSPDGTRLTFDGNGCCNRQIYVVNADGTGLINLTQDGADNIDPDWSPDGTKIAYSNTSLWVIAADGSSRQSLIGGTAGAGSPKWSPDGTKLAYAAVVNGASQIFVVNADGSGVRQLTSDPANPSMHPSWSPDGSTIIVDRCVNGGSPAPWCPTQTDIFAMNADGTNARNLTNTPSSNEAYARFTPDGAKVGFHSDRDGHLQVYLMDADGANQLNLSSNAWREVSPAFKP